MNLNNIIMLYLKSQTQNTVYYIYCVCVNHIHTIWFHVYEILGKANYTDRKQISGQG